VSEEEKDGSNNPAMRLMLWILLLFYSIGESISKTKPKDEKDESKMETPDQVQR
jgi:hypothetical protein